VALTMAIIAFFVILFGVALLQTVLVQGQIHLDGLRTQAVEREAEVQTTRASVAADSSPASIIEKAEALGLVPVEQIYVPPTPEAEPTAP
jgi:cell division protein FtsL